MIPRGVCSPPGISVKDQGERCFLPLRLMTGYCNFLLERTVQFVQPGDNPQPLHIYQLSEIRGDIFLLDVSSHLTQS